MEDCIKKDEKLNKVSEKSGRMEKKVTKFSTVIKFTRKVLSASYKSSLGSRNACSILFRLYCITLLSEKLPDEDGTAKWKSKLTYFLALSAFKMKKNGPSTYSICRFQ